MRRRKYSDKENYKNFENIERKKEIKYCSLPLGANYNLI